MTHTGAFVALARYLDRGRTVPACQDHPGCRLSAGHDGPPLVSRVADRLNGGVAR